MCTLAWGHTDAGLWACFNRDEQRTRPIAEPPRLHGQWNPPLVFARDPQGEGTWFAVSLAGFAVALLNHYPAAPGTRPDVFRSRGSLVVELAGLPSADDAFSRVCGISLAEYAPFNLFVLSLESVKACAWDGSDLTHPDLTGNFWSTSSFLPAEVAAWRRDWWDRLPDKADMTPAEIGQCLRRTVPEMPAHGVTMDRNETRTFSQIELMLARDSCRFSYRDRDPSGSGYLEPHVVEASQPPKGPYV